MPRRAIIAQILLVAVAVSGCAGSGADLQSPPRATVVGVTPCPIECLDLIAVRPGGKFAWAEVGAATGPGGSVIKQALDYHVHAVGPDGRLQWRSAQHWYVVRAIAPTKGGGALVGHDRVITELDAQGEPLTTTALPGFLVDEISVAPDGSMVVAGEPDDIPSENANEASAVFALSPAGKIRWHDRIDSLAGIDYGGGPDARVSIGALARSPDGTIYIGTSGMVTALTPMDTGAGRLTWAGAAGRSTPF